MQITFSTEEISRTEDKSVLQFTISDTGIGMSQDYLPKIFDAFSQEESTDSSLASKYGSTGLGMPITKNLVELMNGSIKVESEKGRGTTFIVTVTLKHAMPQDWTEAEPGYPDGSGARTGAGEVGNGKTDASSGTGDRDTAASPAGEALSDGREKEDHGRSLEGCRILLAEDMDVNAEIIIMMLSMHGMTIERAKNGQIAVDMYKAQNPGYYDAVLMDMRMPVLNGIEASRMIRESGRGDARTIPIIALTANAFEEDVQRSMQAGLDAHLSKPVDPKELLKTLGRLVKAL